MIDPLPYLSALLTCLGEQTSDTGDPAGAGTPEWMGLVPARTVVQDYCTATCGMGFVRLHELYQSTRFPQADITPGPCRAPWAMAVEVGVYRCLPVTAPTPEESAAAVAVQVLDAQAILRTIECCPALVKRPRVVGRYTPVGPNGGCGGGSWNVTYQVV